MNTHLQKLYQKNGLVIMRMARDLYISNVGDRIPTIDNYSSIVSTGRGTIQTALKFLVDNQCITLSKHGHKGTIITSLDKNRLWKYTGWETVFGACPFPTGNLLPSIIATIHYTLQKSGIPFAIGYDITAYNRMSGLESNRYSFILTTRLAIDVSVDEYKDVEVAVELRGCNYSSPYSLIHCIDGFTGIKDGMKIASNPRSAEQNFLSKQLAKRNNIKIVEMSHKESLSALKSGKVDGLLARPEVFKGTIQISRVMPDFKYHIHSLEYLGYDELSTRPVIVVNKNNYNMAKLMRNIMDTGDMARIQKQILNNELEIYYY